MPKTSMRPWDSPEDYLRRVSQATRKSSKAAAHFRPAASMLNSNPPTCLGCKHFLHPFLEGGFDPQQRHGTCEKVKGKIRKEMVCDLWRSRT